MLIRTGLGLQARLSGEVSGLQRSAKSEQQSLTMTVSDSMQQLKDQLLVKLQRSEFLVEQLQAEMQVRAGSGGAASEQPSQWQCAEPPGSGSQGNAAESARVWAELSGRLEQLGHDGHAAAEAWKEHSSQVAESSRELMDSRLLGHQQQMDRKAEQFQQQATAVQRSVDDLGGAQKQLATDAAGSLERRLGEERSSMLAKLHQTQMQLSDDLTAADRQIREHVATNIRRLQDGHDQAVHLMSGATEKQQARFKELEGLEEAQADALHRAVSRLDGEMRGATQRLDDLDGLVAAQCDDIVSATLQHGNALAEELTKVNAGLAAERTESTQSCAALWREIEQRGDEQEQAFLEAQQREAELRLSLRDAQTLQHNELRQWAIDKLASLDEAIESESAHRTTQLDEAGTSLGEYQQRLGEQQKRLDEQQKRLEAVTQGLKRKADRAAVELAAHAQRQHLDNEMAQYMDAAVQAELQLEKRLGQLQEVQKAVATELAGGQRATVEQLKADAQALQLSLSGEQSAAVGRLQGEMQAMRVALSDEHNGAMGALRQELGQQRDELGTRLHEVSASLAGSIAETALSLRADAQKEVVGLSASLDSTASALKVEGVAHSSALSSGLAQCKASSVAQIAEVRDECFGHTRVVEERLTRQLSDKTAALAGRVAECATIEYVATEVRMALPSLPTFPPPFYSLACVSA